MVARAHRYVFAVCAWVGGGIRTPTHMELIPYRVEACVQGLIRRAGAIRDKQLGLSEKGRTLTKFFTFSRVYQSNSS